ncbi:hypothetical protein HAX54_010224 [Datura stramonium]|uniref:Uncharacterized protein n=1 Tax=Datura stramonium TaxID=4076 RepID=A0ABS8RWL0_DATST|nr:hypothetical protein [Datura stramonium]
MLLIYLNKISDARPRVSGDSELMWPAGAVRGEERRVTGEGGYGGFCLVRREREKRKWDDGAVIRGARPSRRLVRLEVREESGGGCAAKWITNAEQSNELQSLISRGRRQGLFFLFPLDSELVDISGLELALYFRAEFNGIDDNGVIV